MYAPQPTQSLRVTNQVGQTNASPYSHLQEQTRASMQLNQTSRQAKMLTINNSSQKAAKRGQSTDLHYKLQLPEIMQQQQSKINQMKKQHEIRFSSKRPL